MRVHFPIPARDRLAIGVWPSACASHRVPSPSPFAGVADLQDAAKAKRQERLGEAAERVAHGVD
eukprot:7389128-Prymnesium_polylepis.2